MSPVDLIVDSTDRKWRHHRHGDRFEHHRLGLTGQVPRARLGASLYRIPPGKTAFPHHAHHCNDESIYVLRGQGTLRLGDERHEVREGHYLIFPAGGAAHQLINSGPGDLEYLCLSTMTLPEVVEYPDSGKLGCASAAPFAGPAFGGRNRAMFLADRQADYYDGE